MATGSRSDFLKANTATAAAVAAALALHWFLLYPYLARADHDFDAVHMYLPLAQRLLAEGFAFFGTEASIQMPPFSYAWPALFGAKLASVKMANFLLSGATLVLVFRTAWLLHSRAAGVAAAFLFAACPLFRPTLATAISEPPYLLLVTVWIWALAEWFASARRVFIPIAGIAFGLAILTRGTFFYWLLALIAFFAWRREKGALVAHLIALALPLAFIAKNALIFSFPFFATGAGNALYLGTNPVTGGYDPIYVGLIFDVGAIAPGPAPLTLDAEHRLGTVARMLLAETDKGQLAAMWAKKLAAFLFVSNAAEGDVPWLRAWRIATMVLAAVGVMGIASRALRCVVAGSVLYQVAIHVPVLYTMRYSVGAMDLWLVLLAGIGIAPLYVRRSAAAIAVVAGAATAGV
ncbi:MAG: ArnT family glycosyltransferase, partial [Usitatibacter sp.]